MGKVYLVGAGPGDAGLITVKGLEKLKECDAVVYDRLASDELLRYVKPECDKIYVGKQAGQHYKKQEEINEILVECARTHRTVVRLKGGDSFVFGRGGEEIEALTRCDIPYEVIPGVTSAVAVPECAGIPVTHRGVSRSFHVITGHTNTSVGSPDYDYETLAKNEGTLVFLMGLSNLGEIAKRLMEAGKPIDTPVAVISEGTTERQRVERGTLSDIADEVRKREMVSPAVIVVGDAAEYRYLYQKDCKRAGITGTAPLRDKLGHGLESLGIQPVSVCNMEVVPTRELEQLDGELAHLNRYQWVMFTSQNAVRLFFAEMKRCGIDMRTLGSLRFAVIGSGTADALWEQGIRADFIPSRYTVPVMAQEFAGIVKPGERVLIPRAVQGSPELPAILSEHGIDYQDIPIYDVVGTLTKNISCLDSLDYLVFVSASGVSAFFGELRKQKAVLPEKIKLACIGKVAQERLLKEYGRADVVAEVNDVEGLLETVKEYELHCEHRRKTEVVIHDAHEKITRK